MYGRAGLDRFKKAQSVDPFSVTVNPASEKNNQSVNKTVVQPSVQSLHSQTANLKPHYQQQLNAPSKQTAPEAAPLLGQIQQVTQFGGGQSTWQPPDWAIEPRPGVYYLEVLKDGEVVDKISLDRRRHIFGRQQPTCDFVLDHQSVSRQHAAVIPHKDGSIYVIDLGSAHGTFVANERLTKDSPVELEVGQSLRFAASTRTYILRKNNAALFPRPPLPTEISLPSPDDPDYEDALVAYNTLLNRGGWKESDLPPESKKSGTSVVNKDDDAQPKRPTKRIKKARVAFRDQVGGELVEIVGYSDAADVETEPGPIGVKEGSLVGKYESLVQVTVVPKGKERFPAKEEDNSHKGVTDKLKEVLNKVRTLPKGGICDDLYGESFSGKVGSSWALPSAGADVQPASPGGNSPGKVVSGISNNTSKQDGADSEDDLFGD